MNTRLWRLVRDSRGATAVEYGLIAALIAVAASGAIALFADKAVAMWNYVANTSGNAL